MSRVPPPAEAATRRALIFDLDDTLAASKSPLSDAMAETIADLLDRYDVAVISGAQHAQFQDQVVARLPARAALAHLHLLPTCGAAYHRFVDGRWALVRAESLSRAEVEAAHAALESCARALGLWAATTWGDRIEDRGAQVTFSALGQHAPLRAKRAWDPDGAKRERLRACAQAKLPELEVRSGGTTSVDVTRRGIDKGYGVRVLLSALGLTAADATFFGDRLDPGGNDHPVLATGVRCVEVRDPEDTVAKLAAYLT